MKGAYFKSSMRTVCRKDSRKWENRHLHQSSVSKGTMRLWGMSKSESLFLFRGPYPCPATPLRPLFSLSFAPSLLPEGLLNWHRFCTVPGSKSLPKCFHSVTPSWPYTASTQKKGGLRASFSIGLPSLGTHRGNADFLFSEQPKVSNTKTNRNSVSMWCKSARQTLCKILVLVLAQTEQSLLVRLLVERMQTRHSAGGLRVTPSSCSVSEVLKTSQRTFLSETAGGIRAEQGRKNSGAPGEKRVISFTKPKDFWADATTVCRTSVN